MQLVSTEPATVAPAFTQWRIVKNPGNRIGGKSNSGEGGEDPNVSKKEINGDSRK
jgi:hypothetical protein